MTKDELGLGKLVERLRSRKGEAITRIEKLMDEAAGAITALIAERDALAKDLVHADHALMVVQLAIEEDTTALNDCLWIPDRFGPNESVFDFVGNARSTLNLTVNHDG